MKETLKELIHVLSRGKVTDGIELSRVTKKKMTELLPALRILQDKWLIDVHPITSLISEKYAEEAFFAATPKLICVIHSPQSLNDYVNKLAAQ